MYTYIVGYYPDSRQLLKQGNAIHETHKNTYGAKPTIQYISNQLSQWIVKGLYKGMNDANDDEENEQVALRPYSTAAIISSYDTHDKRIKLYQIENSGVAYPTSLAVFGKVSNNLRQSLKHAITTANSDKEECHNYDTFLDKKIKRVITLLAADLHIYSDDSHHSHASVPVGGEERKGHNYEFDVLITHKNSIQHYIVIA